MRLSFDKPSDGAARLCRVSLSLYACFISVPYWCMILMLAFGGCRGLSPLWALSQLLLPARTHPLCLTRISLTQVLLLVAICPELERCFCIVTAFTMLSILLTEQFSFM